MVKLSRLISMECFFANTPGGQLEDYNAIAKYVWRWLSSQEHREFICEGYHRNVADY